MDVHKFLEGLYKELKKIFTNENSTEQKPVGKNNKGTNFLIFVLAVVLVGILAIIASDFFKSASIKTSAEKTNTEEKTVSQSTSTQYYETMEENRLKALLEAINGVGRVEVLLTIEGSEEQVPAVNVNDSTSDTQEKDNTGGTRNTKQENNGSTVVLSSDGSKSTPLIIKTYKPKIVGVAVVAEGAKDQYVQNQIKEVVTRVYNLKADKVSVNQMKK
jgi:stage III sporulation protein AG